MVIGYTTAEKNMSKRFREKTSDLRFQVRFTKRMGRAIIDVVETKKMNRSEGMK